MQNLSALPCSFWWTPISRLHKMTRFEAKARGTHCCVPWVSICKWQCRHAKCQVLASGIWKGPHQGDCKALSCGVPRLDGALPLHENAQRWQNGPTPLPHGHFGWWANAVPVQWHLFKEILGGSNGPPIFLRGSDGALKWCLCCSGLSGAMEDICGKLQCTFTPSLAWHAHLNFCLVLFCSSPFFLRCHWMIKFKEDSLHLGFCFFISLSFMPPLLNCMPCF